MTNNHPFIKDQKKIRVIVNGANGKMGQHACVTIDQDEACDLVGCLGRNDNLIQSIETMQPDVVVDLTTASAVYENTLMIINAGVHPVIGTSGLMSHQIESLQAMCLDKRLGGIVVPNFSIGAVLMMQFAKIAAQYLPDVEIIEAHHPKKQDAPSATALKTAELISAARTKSPHLMESAPANKARGVWVHEIPIHAVRLPGVLADQQVVFGSPGETLNLHHRTIDRSCFMPGLLLAVKSVQTLSCLYYGLEHLIGDFSPKTS